MTKIAVISDIHGNIEALDAVFADIKSQGITTIYCLGDVVGYGPYPCECIDTLIENKISSLNGNHDLGAMTETDPDALGFYASSGQAIKWTRKQLQPNSKGDVATENRLRYLNDAPIETQIGNMLLLHGAPIYGYEQHVYLYERLVSFDGDKCVFTPDINTNEGKNYLEASFMNLLDRKVNICFVGHTHVPGVLFISPSIPPTNGQKLYLPDYEVFPFIPQDVMPDNQAKLSNDGVAIVNVGSVGQPRDENNKACYAIYETESGVIRYRRVEYDIDKTANTILSIT